MLIKIRYIFYILGGLLSTFCPRGQGGGVEIGQNLVHVVVECPLTMCISADVSIELQSLNFWFTQ